MKHRDPRLRVWTVPVALAALTIFGLASALLGDGPWDAASWVALAIPLGVCMRFGLKRTHH